MLRRETGKLNGWISYTLSKSERQFTNIDEARWYPMRYDRRHNLAVTGNLKIGKKWSLSSTFIYQTGHAVTLPVAATSGRFASETRLLYGDRNNGRMPAYHRLDLGASKELVTRHGRKAQLNFGLYNAYNRANPLYFDFKTVVNPANGVPLGIETKQRSLIPCCLTSATRLIFNQINFNLKSTIAMKTNHTIFSLFLCLVASIPAFSQTSTNSISVPLEKGSHFVGLNATGGYSGGDYKLTNLNTTAQGGIFVAKGLVTGVQLSFDRQYQSNSQPGLVGTINETDAERTDNSFSPELFARYYFFQTRFRPILQVSAGGVFQTTNRTSFAGLETKKSTTEFTAAAGLGLGWFVAKRVSVELLY